MQNKKNNLCEREFCHYRNCVGFQVISFWFLNGFLWETIVVHRRRIRSKNFHRSEIKFLIDYRYRHKISWKSLLRMIVFSLEMLILDCVRNVGFIMTRWCFVVTNNDRKGCHEREEVLYAMTFYPLKNIFCCKSILLTSFIKLIMICKACYVQAFTNIVLYCVYYSKSKAFSAIR